MNAGHRSSPDSQSSSSSRRRTWGCSGGRRAVHSSRSRRRTPRWKTRCPGPHTRAEVEGRARRSRCRTPALEPRSSFGRRRSCRERRTTIRMSRATYNRRRCKSAKNRNRVVLADVRSKFRSHVRRPYRLFRARRELGIGLLTGDLQLSERGLAPSHSRRAACRSRRVARHSGTESPLPAPRLACRHRPQS